MKYQILAEYFSRLEETPSRNEMTQILAELLAKAEGAEIEQVCYLSLGELAPPYRKIDFNVAEKLMVRAIAEAFDTDPVSVTAAFKKKGDLGNVVFELSSSRGETGSLTVGEVFSTLEEVAQDSGQGSVERKIRGLSLLLRKTDRLGGKYLARIPVGKMRLGFSDLTVLDALSVMVAGDKSVRKEIERAYSARADIGSIARLVKEGGLKKIARLQVVPGVPIRAALAERVPSAEKIFEKMGSAGVLEPKIDGFRVQIHLDWSQKSRTKGSDNLFSGPSAGEPLVKIFSRSLEDMTYMFPDIAKEVKALTKVKAAIFDGEAIGLDPQTGEFLPFQETVQRKRKHQIDQKAGTLPLKVFLFDLLYCDGITFLARPFSQRRRRLEEIMVGKNGSLVLVEQHPLKSAAQLRERFEGYLHQGLEGVMIKKNDSPYQAGGRNFNWVKFKKNTEGNLVDTIDGVVMGYYRGRGKRQEFGLGAFLVGVRGEGEKLVTLAKIGTGLTDEQWRELYRACERFREDSPPETYLVDKNLAPDVWVSPGVVVEVVADEITRSPIHTCGYDPKRGSGLALRFPRLVRFREKAVADATTQEEVAKMFRQQHLKRE